ncbi:hypothetical protein ACFCZV_37110 [Streptomyces hydrogenans]|uniref:hypothetical protein n=1 Tax=Streptomyces hydrogenans TaxID=1873719 RepID=UPI0035E38CFC
MSRSDTFAIEVMSEDPPFPMRQGSGATGVITVGDFAESFYMDLSFWGIEDYRRSWRDSLRVALERSESDSCLVTSLTDPMASEFIFCWPVYRRGEDVFVQNSILFLGELEREFSPLEPWSSVRSRVTSDEDGNVISEWRTTVSAVLEFLGGERQV